MKTRSGTPGAGLEGGVHRRVERDRVLALLERRHGGRVVHRAHVHPLEECERVRALAGGAERAAHQLRLPARARQRRRQVLDHLGRASARIEEQAHRHAVPHTGASLPSAYTRAVLRSSRALRTLAWGAVAVGVAAPLLRHRLRLRAPVVTALSYQAPVALALATPRSRVRDAGIYALQMWAYYAHYDMPDDDPDRLLRRTRVDYPISVDRALGGGETPTTRLQRALGRPGRIRPHDLALSWVHWSWFFVPHGSLVYVLVRHPGQYARSATLHGRHVRPRAAGLLGGPDRAALVRGRERPDGARAADHGRGRRAVLGSPLAPALRFTRRQPVCRHAVPSFRYIRDGRPGPHGRGQGAWRARLGVRAHAGLRPRLSGRALRRRPGGRACAGGDGPAPRARRRPAGGGGWAEDPAAGAGVRRDRRSRARRAGGARPRGRGGSARLGDAVRPPPARLAGARLHPRDRGDLLPVPEGRGPRRRDRPDRRRRRGTGWWWRSAFNLAAFAVVRRPLPRDPRGAGRARSSAAWAPRPRTRSPWPGSPPRGSSRRREPGGSCSPTGRCARPGCRGGARPAGWSPSWRSPTRCTSSRS